ncbi:MAG TPA: putative Ig domain-containing protein, partial [Candidatus Paceibacterota bacterium]|nr:putative Ig domain-containing protein [Candidatus Paceibacterota bacterium]
MTQRLSTNLRRPVVFGILIIGTLAGLSVYAAYRASDVVGQLDDSGQVIWTRGGVNGGPNDHGRSGSGGVTVDLVHHRLFVAEFSNARILVYALDGNNNLISHHAQNVIGQVDFVTVRSGVGPDRFLVGGSVFQVNMAYDPVHDRLFVVDSGNDRVLVFDTSNITNGMSASYVIGQSDLNSAGSHLAQNGLGWPTDVTYDAVHDRLFVTDLLYSRIMVYDMTNLGNGMNASYVIGQPNFGSAGIGTSSSTFQYVYGSTYDADNDRLFVSDLGNHRVLVFNVASGTIMNGMGAENVIGQSTFTASAASISATGFGEVYGLIYDTSSKRLFAADHFGNRVMIFNADPTVLTPFVTSTDGPSAINVLGQTDFVTAAGDTSQVKLSDPYTFAYDPGNQRLYVSERGNERVTVFDASTSTIVNGEPAQDVIGQLDDSGQPSYIQGGSNSGPNRIGFNLTSGSEGVLVDDVDHRLFVSDVTNQRVLVFGLDNTNALLDHQADFVIGQPNFSNGTSGLAADRLYRPSGMVLDQARHWLFLSDYVNNRVLIYDLTSLQNGPAAIHVLGQTDFISSSSAATAGQFRQPRGLAYDPVNQRLFVADALNNRVLVFDVSNVVDGQAAIHVLGQANFVSSSTATTQNGMNLPIELAYDTITRRLFVGEATNRRVTVWNADPATMTDGEPALHVLGQPNFTTAVQTTTASGLMEAFGLALVGANDVLWVADRANHRLVSYDVSPDNIVDGEPALAVIGQPDFVTTGASTSQTGMNFPSALGYDNTNGHLYVGETKNNRVLIFALPKLSGAYLSVGAQGSAYQEAVTTSNVQGTLSYAIATGTLPDGVVLNTSTGQLSGTPSSTGTFTFTIRALDNNGSNGTMVDSRVYTITIQPPHGGGESLPPAAPGSVVTMGPSNTSSGPSSGGVSPLASSTG